MTSVIKDVIAACEATYVLLNQDQVWVDAKGNRHDITEMSVRYKTNVIGFLERRAAVLAEHWGIGEFAFIYGTLAPTVVPDEDGNPVEGPLAPAFAPMGEMAQDALETELEAAQERRFADPVAWLQTTKLHIRLAADVAMGLGGTDGDAEHRRYIARREGCADADGRGHTTYDPDCAVCVAFNSDAPGWTLS